MLKALDMERKVLNLSMFDPAVGAVIKSRRMFLTSLKRVPKSHSRTTVGYALLIGAWSH